MKKIQKISLFFRILFQIGFVLNPLLLIIYWLTTAPMPMLFFHGAVSFQFIPKSLIITHAFSMSTKIAGFLITLIPTLIMEFILFFLIKLFKLYEKEEIFSLQNVTLIRNIGYTLLAGQLIDPIYQALISGFLTYPEGHGHRFITITFDGTNAGIILIALLTILISWIMAEGCKLREEQKYTI